MSRAYTNTGESSDEFVPVSKQAWLNNLQATINQQVWDNFVGGQQKESVTLYPVYTKEDLPPEVVSLNSTKALWQYHTCCQVRHSQDLKTIRHTLEQLSGQGMQGIDLHWMSDELFSFTAVNPLLNELAARQLSIALYLPPAFSKALPDQRSDLQNQNTNVSFYIAPGIQPDSTVQPHPALEWIGKSAHQFRVLGMSSLAFAGQGSTVVQELAFVLSYWVDCLDKLTDRQVALETALQYSEFSLSTSSHYFINIAKFRAMRLLLDQIVAAYGARQEVFTLKAVSGTVNKTLYDPVSNMLRNTSEAMSAIIGGCDILSLIPHDFAYSNSRSFGARMACNISNLLLHEAHIDKVHDPAAGSFFVEHLTRQLVDQAWTLFLDMEDRGGYSALLQSGWIAQQLSASHQEKQQAVRLRTQTIVGTSRYIDSNEVVDTTKVLTDEQKVTNTRYAAAFERLRLATDQYFLQGGVKPAVTLIIFPEGQSPGLINARMAFIQDVMHSAGLAVNVVIYASETFSLPVDQQSVWIMCGTPEFYRQGLPALLDDCLSGVALMPAIYLAGKPDSSLHDNSTYQGCIYAGADMVSLLKDILKHQGIHP